MAELYKENIVDIDLAKGNIHRKFLSYAIGTGDNAADRFGIRVFRDGEEVDLTGCSCYGFFRNPQGINIALTSHGTVDGNLAYVTLPQACYDYDGQFSLAIKLIGGGVTGTMRIVDGIVDNANTGSAVAPTSSVPTYQEILSTYDAMVAATSAANTAIAETFDATKAYPAGKYVINSGALYLLPAGHAANATWANTSKVAVNFGDELTSTKSALNVDETMIGIIPFWSPNTNNAATAASPAVGNVGNLYTIDGSRTNTSPLYVDFSDTSRKTAANQPAGYIELKAGHSYIIKYDPIVKNNIENERIHIRDKANNVKIAEVYEGEERIISISEDVTASFMFILPGSTTYSNYKFRAWLLDVTNYNLLSKMTENKNEFLHMMEKVDGLINYWGNDYVYSSDYYGVSLYQEYNKISLSGTSSAISYRSLSDGEARNTLSKDNLSRTLSIKAGNKYTVKCNIINPNNSVRVTIKLYDGNKDLISFYADEELEGECIAEEDATAVLCCVYASSLTFDNFQFEVDLVEKDYVAEDINFWRGKKVAWFGDSLSAGSVLANKYNAFPYKTADALGMTIYNHAIGGSVIAKETKAQAEAMGAGYYDEIVFSLDEFNTMEKDTTKAYLVLDDPTDSHPYRIYSYVNGEWTPTSAHTSVINGRYPIVDVAKGTEADADLIVIALAFNDFMYHWTPFGDMSSRDKNTFYGALHTLCQYLLSEHGDKQIIFVKVIASRYQRDGSVNADWDCLYPDSVNPIGKTIGDYRKAMDEVCLYYSIPCFDLGANLGFAQYQHPEAYYFSDNLHWKAAGHKRAASVLAPMIRNLRITIA